MYKSIRLFLLVAGAAFPLSGYTQGAVQFHPLGDRVFTQSLDEEREIGVWVKSQLRGYDLGPPFPPLMATARWQLLGGNPLTANFVDQEFDLANGFAIFRIEPGSTQMDGTACVLVNGQEICSVAVKNGRLVYRAGFFISNKATSDTAEEVPLPVVSVSVSTTVYDRLTRETHTGAADVIPIAILDGNAIVSQSD